MAEKQQQVKQVWFTDRDEINFALIGKALKEMGVDVEPDNRKAASPYSHTKIVRHLMEQEANRIRAGLLNQLPDES